MGYPQYRAKNRSSNTSTIKWIIIVLIIVGGIFFVKNLSSPSNKIDGTGLTIGGSGSVAILDETGKKKNADIGDIFSIKDSMLSVLSGIISLTHQNTTYWLDKGANINAESLSTSGSHISLINGRIWMESGDENHIKMKHITAISAKDTIILLEQQKIHSIVYALKGDVMIDAGPGRSYTLTSGKRIMVSQSDLVNPGIDLSTLTDTIDDNIRQTALFIARNGENILKENTISVSTGSLSTGSGGTGGVITSGILGTGFISITSPADGALISGRSLTIEGQILSPNVTKIIINDTEVSKKNNTSWSLNTLSMESDIFDIVYKAYDSGGNLLERGVITVYASEKQSSGTDKLIPTTFPTSDVNYKIVSPLENPYKTSLSAVTVSGSVPKDTVSYITVNNFRLKKFIPNSTSWYYYANTAYGTMKEGFNLYEIKFFGPDNSILYTQLFTIIKEGESSTISGE